MPAGERDTIARLLARFGAGVPGLDVGIGDDAAVLDPRNVPGAAGKRLVWTIDEQVEETHFRRALAGWADVGFRSFMAAASDVAAMGAEPWCALSALALPADLDDDVVDALSEGQRIAAEAVGAPIVGGNLARAAVVSVTTTVLGWAERPITRAGARAGDRVFVAGSLGLARAGFLALERGVRDARLRPAVAAWLRPVARIADGRAMGPGVHAAIDVSDGLAGDAAHLARAGEVRIVFDERKLMEHAGPALAQAASALGQRAIELVLQGGEDYALLAVGEEAPPGFSDVGYVREGPAGVFVVDVAGRERQAVDAGFDHFAPP